MRSRTSFFLPRDLCAAATGCDERLAALAPPTPAGPRQGDCQRSGTRRRRQRSLAGNGFDELPVEIIEETGTPLGYVCVLNHVDHDVIDELALVPEAQGGGIGSSLVRDVMGAACKRGAPVRLSMLATAQHAVSASASASALAQSSRRA